VTANINVAGILRVFYPLNSLDLSPRDVSAFERLKREIMDRHLQSADEIWEMTQANAVKRLWMTIKTLSPNG